MKITVFAKKRNTQEGKVFYTYIGRLTKKATGEIITVQVKFREECGAPKHEICPRVIEFDKKDANYTEQQIPRDDGSVILSRVMWISKWKDVGAYVDTSMDEFA